MPKKKTHEEFILDLQRVNSNIDVLTAYTTTHSKIQLKCLICEHIWWGMPSNILRGHGCPECAKHNRTHKTHQQYMADLVKVNLNIEVLEEYVGSDYSILHRCRICNHKWLARPYNILAGKGCPVCAHRIIGNAPEYRNSIWANTFLREKLQGIVSDDILKSYVPSSTHKVMVECPYCHNTSEHTLRDLCLRGVACNCNDGVSFPNKFIYNVLSQLKLSMVLEWSPIWADGKLYDIYIPKYNTIVENHGRQHYDDHGFGMIGGRTLDEEIHNDELKRALAKTNKIDHYIELNCRYSDADWIKESVMNSELPCILNFNADDIDWEQALSYACKNLIKEASSLYKEGHSILEIHNILQVSNVTIRKWLKIGTKLNWCDYNAKENRNFGLSFGRVVSRKKVYCLELGQFFESASQAASLLGNADAGHISSCCRGEHKTAYGYHWQYIT